MFNIKILLLQVLCVITTAASDLEHISCLRQDGYPGRCLHFEDCGMPEETDTENQLADSECAAQKVSLPKFVDKDKAKVDEGIRLLKAQDCGRSLDLEPMRGNEIGIMSRPWMALLFVSNSTHNGICSGTLISRRYVLTAAHCLEHLILSSVRLGEHNTSSEIDCHWHRQQFICAPPVRNVAPEIVFIHEKYSERTKRNDIALVKLAENVQFTESVQPICLPVSESQRRVIEEADTFRVTGWGETLSRNTSDVPQETYVSKKDRASCSNRIYKKIIETQVCAGSRGRDSCKGDSGGPLFSEIRTEDGTKQYLQIGIVSYGIILCGIEPSVYTNVSSYIPWIAHKISNQ